MHDALTSAARDWSLTNPHLIAETPRAWVYRVRLPSGALAALKLANPAVDGDEARAPDWLRWANGRAAVQVLGAAPDRLLLEWIDGPPLSALCDAGRDAQAARILAALVREHSAIEEPCTAALPVMEDMPPRFCAATLRAGRPRFAKACWRRAPCAAT